MNRPLRINATLLESFRLYRQTEWFDESELIASIKGEFLPTPAIRLGRAYHSCVEQPQLSLAGFYERDGFRFEPKAIDEMRTRILPGGLFEVKTTKTLSIEADDVTLVCKCDHIVGSHIDEFKTSDRFDADRYLASVQWRVMAWLFEASSVGYHVATLAEDDEDDMVRLKGIESMNVFPYAGLEGDCRELVHEFCQYLHTKGLEDYLRKQMGVAV